MRLWRPHGRLAAGQARRLHTSLRRSPACLPGRMGLIRGWPGGVNHAGARAAGPAMAGARREHAGGLAPGRGPGQVMRPVPGGWRGGCARRACRWIASVTAQRRIREPCLVTCPWLALVPDSRWRGSARPSCTAARDRGSGGCRRSPRPGHAWPPVPWVSEPVTGMPSLASTACTWFRQEVRSLTSLCAVAGQLAQLPDLLGANDCRREGRQATTSHDCRR
jgi:hypothetical protein